VKAWRHYSHYIIASLFIHLAIVLLVIQLQPIPKLPEPKNEIIKSYLAVAKPKSEPLKETEQLEETGQQLEQSESEQEIVEEVVSQQEPEAVVKEPVNSEPELVTQPTEQTPQQQNEETAIETQQTQNLDKAPSRVRSPYAAAQQYLQQMDTDQIKSLSRDALTSFRTPQPLNPEKGPKTTNQMIKERSEAFAPKGSGVLVLAESSHNDRLILLHGNCFRVTENERGEQQWQGSNGCGNYDKFNGQLKKSLDKYLKK